MPQGARLASTNGAWSQPAGAGAGQWTTPVLRELVDVAPPAVVEPAHDPRRFYGTVRLPATRLSRDVGTIAQEVIQHLAGLVGAEVDITLEVQVLMPGGAPPHVVRTVTENCRTLGFTQAGFEEE